VKRACTALLGLILLSPPVAADQAQAQLRRRYRFCLARNPLSPRTYRALVSYCAALRRTGRRAQARACFERYRQQVGLDRATRRQLWSDQSARMLNQALRLESDGQFQSARTRYLQLTTEVTLSYEGCPGRWHPQSPAEQAWRGVLRTERQPAERALLRAELLLRQGEHEALRALLRPLETGKKTRAAAIYLAAVSAFVEHDFARVGQLIRRLLGLPASPGWTAAGIYLAGRAEEELAMGTSPSRRRFARFPYDQVLEGDFEGLRLRRGQQSASLTRSLALYGRLRKHYPRSRLADDALYSISGLAYWQGDFERAYQTYALLERPGHCARKARRRRRLCALALETLLKPAARVRLLAQWPAGRALRYLQDSQRYRTLADWTAISGRAPQPALQRIALLGLAEGRGRETVGQDWRVWAWRQLLQASQPSQAVWVKSLEALCARALASGQARRAGRLLRQGLQESLSVRGPGAASLSQVACRLLRLYPAQFDPLAPALALSILHCPTQRTQTLETVRQTLAIHGSPAARARWVASLRAALPADTDHVLARELVAWGQSDSHTLAHVIDRLRRGQDVPGALALLSLHVPVASLGSADLSLLTRLLGPYFFRLPGAVDYLYPRLTKRGFFEDHWQLSWAEVFGTVAGIRRFLQRYPHSAWRGRLQILLARRLVDEGRYAEAIPICQRQLRRDPLGDRSPEIAALLVQCLKLRRLKLSAPGQTYLLARALYRSAPGPAPTYDLYLLQKPAWRAATIAAMMRRQPILQAARRFEQLAKNRPKDKQAAPALYSAATAYLKAIDLGPSYQQIRAQLRKLAVSGYERLLVQHPRSPLADDACYWAARFTDDLPKRRRLLELLQKNYPSSPFVGRASKLIASPRKDAIPSAKQRRLQRLVDNLVHAPSQATLDKLVELLGNHWISTAGRFRAAAEASRRLLERGQPRFALRVLRGALHQLSFDETNPLSIGHLLTDRAACLEADLLRSR